jgi:hypothetical protein
MPEDPTTPSTTAPSRKRRRPPLSCQQCRRRKIKCDRGSPCRQCVQSQYESCSYSPNPGVLGAGRHVDVPCRPKDIPISRAHISSIQLSPELVTHSDTSHTNSWTSPSFGAQTEDSADIKALLDRIQNLEKRLENSTTRGGIDVSKPSSKESHSELRGTVSKTRFFGCSHWMYSYRPVKRPYFESLQETS